MKKKFIIPIILLVGALGVVYANGGISLNTKAENIKQSESNLKVETKAISDDNEVLESNIKIPIFTGENNNEILTQINNIFESDALDFRENLSKMAESDFQSAKKDNVDFRKYELLVDYEAHTINNDLISVTSLNYQYTGGAHGISIRVPYNFDLVTGKEVELKDLFKEESNYKKIINEEIQKQIKEDPDKFFPDEVELFSGINDDQFFFIEDGNLVIYFNQYEIAPYSSGIIEFQIPNNILKDVINSPLIK